MSKNKNNNTSSNKRGFFGTIGRWTRRMFFGASKEMLDDDNTNKTEAEMTEKDVADTSSPAKQILMGFWARKYAVVAVIVVILMFIVAFIGPLFIRNYNDSYTETLQQNISPTMSMMKVPKELRDDIKMIDSYASFTVGLSNAGKVYVWGSTQLGTTGIDISDIPQEVQDKKIAFVAAGIDHIIAIAEDGQIYGWGANTLGQYYRTENNLYREEQGTVAAMPEELCNNGIDVKKIKKLECGYQATVILMDDGTIYIWGNKNAYSNIDTFLYRNTGYRDIVFTLNYIVGISENGKSIITGQKNLYDSLRTSSTGLGEKVNNYLNGRTIESVLATSSNLCYVLSDNSVAFTGNFDTEYAVEIPKLAEGEYYTSISAGIHHYSGVTNLGNVYSFGSDKRYQCDLPSNTEGVSSVIATGFQNYGLDDEGNLAKTWGNKGYLFGTDKNGADIFYRIIYGSKMTMTIGAVAVIISTIIGIIVGCISGYFGGKVDMILMRVTEVFAAIPFLPFALILSAIMGRMPFGENARIFIIMCILGVLSWTGLARLVRGQVLVVRESEYVTAAKAMGVKESKIAFRHILPNIISIIIVALTLDFAGCMLTESSLSYLGFGVSVPKPTWGNMLNSANNATIMNFFWWQWVFTALFLAITTICINIIGDTLRDVMDPKSNPR